MTLYFTVGAIGKIWLENHLTLFPGLNILFSFTAKEKSAHHAKTAKKEKK